MTHSARLFESVQIAHWYRVRVRVEVRRLQMIMGPDATRQASCIQIGVILVSVLRGSFSWVICSVVGHGCDVGWEEVKRGGTCCSRYCLDMLTLNPQ